MGLTKCEVRGCVRPTQGRFTPRCQVHEAAHMAAMEADSVRDALDACATLEDVKAFIKANLL